jgi:hypothetical protein
VRVMPRPRVVNPTGPTVRLATIVAEPVARRVEREAQRRGVTVAQVLRDALERVA